MSVFIRPSQFSGVPLGANLTQILKADFTEQTFTNSAAENTLWSGTLTGGVLGANDALNLFFMGTINNASGALRTYTVRFKLGGTTFGSGAMGVNSAINGTYVLEAFIKNVGATNSQKANFKGICEGGGASYGFFGTAAIDTTVNQTIAVTIQADAATASQTINHVYTLCYYLNNT